MLEFIFAAGLCQTATVAHRCAVALTEHSSAALHRCALRLRNRSTFGSRAAAKTAMEPAAPHPEPAAMETETKVSIKTMKEVIRSAGLATADLLEKRDIEARYKQAQARLEEAERLEREKNQPKKKRRIIEESSDDDDDGPMIPEPTGVKTSTVNKFSQYKHVEDEEPGGWTNTKKTAAEVRRDARKGAAHLAREKASKTKKPPPKKRRGAFAEESDPEESEEEASYNGNTSDDEEEDEIGSLPSDSGSDVEVVADDRKSKLDALAARKRAGKRAHGLARLVQGLAMKSE